MARTVVFCEHCRNENSWPKPVVRVTMDPCDICGGWDAYRKRQRHPRTGEPIDRVVKMKNYEHRADMLPGTPEFGRTQQALVDQ